MKTKNWLLTLLLSTTLTACSAYSAHAAAPAMVSNGMLTGSNGMTLYVFDKDAAGSGKSMCNGPCAANWPPLMAMEGDVAGGDYSIVSRDDGKKQCKAARDKRWWRSAVFWGNKCLAWLNKIVQHNTRWLISASAT